MTPSAPAAAAAPPEPQKTVLGMPATFGLPATPSAPPTEAPATTSSPPRASQQNATMLGMPMSELPQIPAPAPAPAASPAPVPSKPAVDPNSNRTMLGVPLRPPETETKPSKRNLDAQTNRTMLGVMNAAPNASSSSTPPQSAWDAPSQPNAGGDEPPAKEKKGLGLYLGLGLVIALLIGGAMWVISKMKTEHVALRVSVVSVATGEAIQVDVSGAENGTKIRFLTQELPLAAGRATFPIETQNLHVGDNALEFTLISPEGARSSETVHVSVDYRVRADVTAIDSAAPSIDVVVDAHAGATATVDGTPLPLDAQGHGVRRVALNTISASSGVLEVTTRYTIANNGAATPAEGTLVTHVAVTNLILDKPGRNVVTDQATIEVTGTVEEGAHVLVDGVSVTPQNGRFSYRLTLSNLGERQIPVTARVTGKAMQQINIHLRRVADLADEAANFGVDRSLTYARIASNPNSFVGQKIELVGTVFNVTRGGGQSVVQMRVEPCTPGEICQVWVTYPATTEVALNATIRVVGTVGGEQQYRSQTGRTNSAPRVDAAFILPPRAAGGRRR